jgi:hypothetical protein
MRDRIKALPEHRAIDAGARQNLLFDESVQHSGDLKSMASGTCSHDVSLKNSR